MFEIMVAAPETVDSGEGIAIEKPQLSRLQISRLPPLFYLLLWCRM